MKLGKAAKGAKTAAAAAAAGDGPAAREAEKEQLPPMLEELSEVSFSNQQQRAQVPQPLGEQYLCITVHEARNLVAKDLDTASSDPFVRVSLGGSVVKKTRVIRRNCHPLWEQKLLLPLEGLSEGVPLLVELFDKDFRAKEWLGQVLMTLGKALEIAADEALGPAYWFGLCKRRSTDIVSGELCLGFDVISDAATYARLSEQLELQQDTDHIAKALASKALRVCLKGMNGLRASGLLAKANKQRQGQSLVIKYGRRIVERTLPADLPAEGDGGEGFELEVNEEVLIPLAAAVRPSPLGARRKDELFDVKLYIKSGGTTVAKTQIPIWDIPISDGSSGNSSSSSASDTMPAVAASVPPAAVSGSAAAAAPAGEVVAEVVVEKPLMASAKSMCDLSSLRELRDKASSRASADSLASSCDFSLPSTPRGARSSAEFLLASLRGLNVSSGTASPLPGSPRHAALRGPELDLVQRSKSDAAGLSLKQQHQHQLAAAAVAAGSSSINRSGVQFVEGSLCSVTASNRCQCPGGLGRRKAQGLAELNDNVRSAFKLLVPKEISHVGWTKTDETCPGLVNVGGQQGKAYFRTMEGLVQLSGLLEVGLTLQLLDHSTIIGSAAVDAASEAADTLVVEALLDDLEDEEEVPDAAPIRPPPPFDLLLVDDTVSTGVNRLHALLLGSSSPLMAQHHAAEQLLDVVVGPWRGGGSDCLRSRQVSYTKKLNIPFAPKQCQVWEEHKLLVKTDGGFVAEIACTNNAPKGDSFVARIQLCGQLIESGSSRLRISMKLDWHKSTLGKSLVQSGAEGDAKRGWAALMKLLRQHTSSSKPGGSLQTVSATPSEASASLTMSAAAAGRASAREWQPQLGMWWLPLLQAGLLAALLLVLVLLVVAVSRGASSISRELQLLTQALQEASNAGCPVSTQSPALARPQPADQLEL